MVMKYFLATDNDKIFHYGSYDDELQQFTTTQPVVNYYDSEEELHAVLEELGIQWKNEPEEPVLELPPEPEPHFPPEE